MKKHSAAGKGKGWSWFHKSKAPLNCSEVLWNSATPEAQVSAHQILEQFENESQNSEKESMEIAVHKMARQVEQVGNALSRPLGQEQSISEEKSKSVRENRFSTPDSEPSSSSAARAR